MQPFVVGRVDLLDEEALKRLDKCGVFFCEMCTYVVNSFELA